MLFRSSELFGHTAGAFTGATHNKIGKFQYADSGTLFLDEIGTASMAMQVRLLRTLQNQTFEPIGSNETLRVDTRTIFATNENLEAAVAEGRFRQDLYYRIHVVPIELPPLRNRLEDLPKLADHFLALACQEFGREFRGFTDSAYRAMAKYRWPGNIRELENTIQRVALTCRSQWIDCDAIDGLLTQRNSKVSNQLTGSTWKTALSRQSRATADTLDARWSEEFLDLEHAMAGPERSIILGALEANDWNRNATALRLGINRTTLYKKMKRLGIDV